VAVQRSQGSDPSFLSAGRRRWRLQPGNGEAGPVEREREAGQGMNGRTSPADVGRCDWIAPRPGSSRAGPVAGLVLLSLPRRIQGPIAALRRPPPSPPPAPSPRCWRWFTSGWPRPCRRRCRSGRAWWRPGPARSGSVGPGVPLGAGPVGAGPVGARPVGARPVGARPVGARPVGARPVGAVEAVRGALADDAQRCCGQCPTPGAGGVGAVERQHVGDEGGGVVAVRPGVAVVDEQAAGAKEGGVLRAGHRRCAGTGRAERGPA